ncbi:gamma-glutamyl kinase [Aestuariibius insulae]|uniref:gamma-glutamyl kinase n=1 Tax=Aestuariibius insulae TaxID=2058287 RepID=UPI00345F0403
MLVFWEQNLVLLAVPKTGSTALMSGLRKHVTMMVTNPPHLKHAPFYRYQRFLHPYFKQAGGKTMETAAVIRHPVDWLSSWYRYRYRDDLVGKKNSTRGISFDEFVLEYAKTEDRKPFAQVGSQYQFVRNSEDEVGVTFLFQYEDQSRFLSFLKRRLDTEIELPIKNVSPKLDLSLSTEVEAELRRARPEEFTTWETAGLSSDEE